MADYPAIAAMSEAVLGLLESAAVGTEFATATFSHYQAGDFQSPMTDGASLYLYRVSVNANRNLPKVRGRDGTLRRPPIPLDVHFLVTPWAGDAIRQQRMLGFAIRTLEDTPILPAAVLNRYGPEPDVFRPEETVELVYENVSVQDAAYIWDVAQTKEQPSATYVARMVEIESRVRVDGGPAVQTRELRFTEDIAN
jgi:hypothetical protein